MTFSILLSAAVLQGIAIGVWAVLHLQKVRNRNLGKGIFVVGFSTVLLIPFLNWLVMILLWLGLKTRDLDSKQLY